MSRDPKTFTFEELRELLLETLVQARGRSRINPSVSHQDALQLLCRAIEGRTGEVDSDRDRLMARNILRECAGSELQAAALAGGLIPGGW